MTGRISGALAPVFSQPSCLEHDTGPRHPESAARLRAVREAVAAADPAALRDVGPANLDSIERVHPRDYLERLQAVAVEGGGRLDPDTVMSAASWEAALGAAGAALAAMDSALAGTPAFAAVRPPGHHALADRAMGFCLISNVVVAAREALARGNQRVLILDWDVHHGNGTQALVEREPAIRFLSMHQWPHWPFSGSADERGVGNVWNLPMRAGLPPERYLEAFWGGVETATRDGAPDLILVSSGFDSMQGDLLGGFTLEPEHYVEWVDRLRERFPATPLAAVLEGGYVPRRVAAGVVAVASALG
ncbi:MAG: histone deacetylase [Gemmatimonadales bacterium]